MCAARARTRVSASLAAAWPGTHRTPRRAAERRVRTGRACPASAALGLCLSGTPRVRLQRPSRPREISRGGRRREGLAARLNWKHQNLGGAPSGLPHSPHCTEPADPTRPTAPNPPRLSWTLVCPGRLPRLPPRAGALWQSAAEPRSRVGTCRARGQRFLPGSARGIPREAAQLPPAIPFYGSWPVAN